MISATKQIPWLRIFLEGVVIVGSILLALALQAWWDGVQSRQETQGELELVLVELTEARQVLSFANVLHQRMFGATEDFRLRLSSVTPDQYVSVPDTLVAGLFLTRVADPPTAAVDALLSRGIDEIENLELRRRLLSWPTLLQDLKDDETRARTFQDRESGPHLRAEFDVAAAQDAATPWALGSEPAPSHVTQFQSTTRLKNLVGWQVHYFEVLTRTSRAVLEQLETLEVLIRQELN